MIHDNLINAEFYFSLHSKFKKAFEFIRNSDLSALGEGEHEIQGRDLYAVVVKTQGKGRDNVRLEGHRRYIDIQCTVSGEDVIGWNSRENSLERDGGYDEIKDVEFFNGRPSDWSLVRENEFAIYMPHDLHAPLGTEQEVHKVVVKVAY